jgi:hypothetical protein
MQANAIVLLNKSLLQSNLDLKCITGASTDQTMKNNDVKKDAVSTKMHASNSSGSSGAR